MNQFLREAERLHALGFAIHWLRPKSKMPVFGGWTKGPRATLRELQKTYKKGMNYGVRLGRASDFGGSYLAVIDVDVKSDSPHHRKEAEKALAKIFPTVIDGPRIISGRGNGSAHYYVRLKEPTSGDETKAQSKERVKVMMPSVLPNKDETATLSFEELAAGVRLRAAWEISLLSEGRQCVLAGSIHPDSGKRYEWVKGIEQAEDIPLLEKVPGGSKTAAEARKAGPETEGLRDWKFQDVDLDTLGLREDQIDAIRTGAGVFDESAKVYELVMALMARGISEDVIVSVFTDKSFHLGRAAYRHKRTSVRRYAAQWVEKYCLKKARIKVSDSDFDFEEIDEVTDENLKRERKRKKKKQIEAAEAVLWPVGFSEPPESWEKQLELKSRGRALAPLVRASYTNILVILQNSCGTPNFLTLDTFSQRARYACDTPWGSKKNDQRSSGKEDALLVKAWLHQKYEMVPSLSMIDEILNGVVELNRYHPLQDYLESIIWDGVPRIDTALKVYFGAEMPEPYLSAVSRKLFIGAVKRAFEPGSTFQHMIVLEGKQGIGKSTGIRILSSKQWFLDALPNLHDKDAALYLVGTWLCEMAELAALSKSTDNPTKAFITRDTDRIRPPYGARRDDFPRTTVFIGTTNLRDYLTDPTGNRRYWPVLCTGVDFEALERDRDQLWAEAVHEYQFGNEKLYLEGKALSQALVIQEEARAEDEIDFMVDLFREWEASTIKENSKIPERLHMVELFEVVWSRFRTDTPTMKRAAQAMRQLGYEKHKSHGTIIWVKK